MKQPKDIREILQRMVASGDWLFAIGVRIRFSNPTLLYQTYPEEWVDHYEANGLLLKDPTIRWGLTHTGLCDWADLKSKDRHGVLEEAAGHGLRHGIAISIGGPRERTLGFFAREESPFTPEEKALAQALVQELHDATEGLAALPEEELDAYRALSVGLNARG